VSEPGFASLGPSLLARKGGAKPAMRPQVAPLVNDEAEIAALADDALEDLGWNDMGHDGDESDVDGGADIVPINADVSADRIASGPGPIVRRQQRRLEERVLADAAMTGPEDFEPEYDEEEEAFYGADDTAEADESEDYAVEGYEDEADEEEQADEHDYAPLATSPLPTSRKTMVNMGANMAAVASPALRSPRMPAAQAGRRAAFTLRLDADRHLKLRLASTMQGVSAQALVTEALDRLLAEFDDLEVIANHLKRH
jgi:hypothetical protein